MKKLFTIVGAVCAFAAASQAQVLLSSGFTYGQDFDSLPSALVGTATTAPWTDNSTLLGWYASRRLPAEVAWTAMRLDSGDNNSGQIHDYGSTASTDRSLGSVSSGTPGTNAIGLLFKNDTGSIFTGDLTINYTGEQWRNGGNVTPQIILGFSYLISSTDLSASVLSAAVPDLNYTLLPALNFTSPTTGAAPAALDGNAAANRVALSGTISGITLNPGDEIMLRWYDINDAGNDHGGGIDDLTATFSTVPEPTTAALGGLALLGLTFWRRRK